MLSSITQLNKITFPEFRHERVYMTRFTKQSGLPSHLSRWQTTVDQMLINVENDNKPIFIMIDQSFVESGTPQRRPGIHIDGVWIESTQSHGTGTGRHKIIDVPPEESTQSLILAADIEGCAVYEGDYDWRPGEGGDFSHIELNNLNKRILDSHTAWAGNAMTTLHESLPLKQNSLRTLVRLNVTNWLPI